MIDDDIIARLDALRVRLALVIAAERMRRVVDHTTNLMRELVADLRALPLRPMPRLVCRLRLAGRRCRVLDVRGAP